LLIISGLHCFGILYQNIWYHCR